LPLKLISFQGALSNNRSQLQWTVAENESGKYFEKKALTEEIIQLPV
jgi:hypothetical protein